MHGYIAFRKILLSEKIEQNTKGISCNVQFVPIDLYPLYVLNVLSWARHAEEGMRLGDALKSHLVVLEHISRFDVSFM